MEAGHVIPEAIQTLLEKRGTYQDWLSRLDELGSDFRPEVAEKVRSDYEGRLTEVQGQLEGHRTELESALAERSGEVERIAARHDTHAAELEETELRHAVGEFDDAEWERRRGEQQGRLDEIESELTEQRSAVDSLQVVLGELTGAAATAGAAEVEAAVEPEPPIPEELVATEEEWPEPEAEDAGAGPDESAEPEVTDAEAADEGDAWMTQPLDEGDADAAKAELVGAEVAELEFADAEFVEAEVVEPAAAEAEVEEAEPEVELAAEEPAEFMDELEFLESLSLDDAENFDAVSAMLDEEEDDSGSEEGSERKTEDL